MFPNSSYFLRQERELQRLRAHGFRRLPTDAELLDYVFAVSDRLDALCGSLGISVEQGRSGLWEVHGLKGEDSHGLVL